MMHWVIHQDSCFIDVLNEFVELFTDLVKKLPPPTGYFSFRIQ